MTDASVKFIDDSIHCGNYGVAPTPNFGVGDALGTVSGGDLPGDF